MTLIVFSGLPGVGKTTLARALAQAQGALHLRIDSIEQAMRDGDGRGEDDIGPRGGRAVAVGGKRLLRRRRTPPSRRDARDRDSRSRPAGLVGDAGAAL